jgi:hypothetical protein
MKTTKELANELETVCAKIQREPLAGERILLCATATYLSEQMRDGCRGELARLEAEREARGPVHIRRSDFFNVATAICDRRARV